MLVKVPHNLPAVEILNGENIPVNIENHRFHKDMHALKIVILNLMPAKTATEAQLLRLLANSPLQVDITLLHPKNHMCKNTPQEHMAAFYTAFDDIMDEKFDGMIITGAPVEHLDFEEVDYWDELEEIMDWSVHNVGSTLHICWGAQAGLYHHYGISKHPLDKKMFGIFRHGVNKKDSKLLHGFDDEFFAPHSRHTGIDREDILKANGLEVLSYSKEAGVYIAASKDGRQIFVTGHPEYDPLTLKGEYDRDISKGLDIEVPKFYFPDDNPSAAPIVKWRGHSNLLFLNWLNYYIQHKTI